MSKISGRISTGSWARARRAAHSVVRFSIGPSELESLLVRDVLISGLLGFGSLGLGSLACCFLPPLAGLRSPGAFFLRVRDMTWPGASQVNGFLSAYPGHTMRALRHFVQTGCTPSQTRRRRRHSQQWGRSTGVGVTAAAAPCSSDVGDGVDSLDWDSEEAGGAGRPDIADCRLQIADYFPFWSRLRVSPSWLRTGWRHGASWRDVPGHKNETRFWQPAGQSMNKALRGIGGPKRSCLAICPAVPAGVSPVVSGQSSVAATGVGPFPKASRKRSWLRRESLGHRIVSIGKELCRGLCHGPAGMIHFASPH
jgi:hypothetical protein